MNWFVLYYYDGNGKLQPASYNAPKFMNPSNDVPYQIEISFAGTYANEFQVAVANKTDVLVTWLAEGITYAAQVNTGMGYNANRPLEVDLHS